MFAGMHGKPRATLVPAQAPGVLPGGKQASPPARAAAP
jgi:hypothetical protein